MKKTFFLLVGMLLVCCVAFAFQTQVELPVVGDVSAPTETMIWMFVTLAVLKIAASGLYVAEVWLLADSRHFLLKGLGFVVKMIRGSLDQIIANTRKLKP